MKKPEILAPAGNFEKLKTAVLYGADAVYVGGKEYGLRAGAENFTFEELKEGIDFAHNRGCKVYITANIYAHNKDLDGIRIYFKKLKELNIDGLIVSDPGVALIAMENDPSIPLHLSTQANCTNWASALFWEKIGFKRIILARELGISEIKEIRKKVSLELEVFVHGAVCVSYSGRCLLSSFLTGRSANRGDCSHPCRWKYYLMEEKRPGEYMPVFEDDRGTYIFNANDLCMIEHIPELVEAGVDSFKIEGRMKSLHYVATVVKAYRQAVDSYFEDPEGWQCREEWKEELNKVSHRKYSTGFFFGKPDSNGYNYSESAYYRSCEFVGKVLKYDPDKGMALVQQKNKFSVGEMVEIIGPVGDPIKIKITEMKNEEGEPITEAPHPEQLVYIPVDIPVEENYIIRKPIAE
ncbi:MAG: U32 family peptidase [Clostridia bacterium]|nr:U32 family peptidase [Clostridia bacterium]